LQQWILKNPDILNESLLIITSEYAGFDRSNRRLDILAMDVNCNVVVIEIKLLLEGTLADLQALRYAAFCSSMTMDQIVSEYARFSKKSQDEAIADIMDFIKVEEDDLPEPGDRPRILLVAGSMNNPEIISTVLWLRTFNIDIKCLEITPYQLSNKDIVLVPRVIVPLPEAAEYQVRVEKKESMRARKEREPSQYISLFEGIVKEYSQLETLLPIARKPMRSYLQIGTGDSYIHYEWLVKKRANQFHIGIHFESTDRGRNEKLVDFINRHKAEITKSIDSPFKAEMWGKVWGYAAFIIPLDEILNNREYLKRSASMMDTLIRRTWPMLQKYLR
jgi:hypothetical protein